MRDSSLGKILQALQLRLDEVLLSAEDAASDQKGEYGFQTPPRKAGGQLDDSTVVQLLTVVASAADYAKSLHDEELVARLRRVEQASASAAAEHFGVDLAQMLLGKLAQQQRTEAAPSDSVSDPLSDCDRSGADAGVNSGETGARGNDCDAAAATLAPTDAAVRSMSDDELRRAASADPLWADYVRTRRPELADWDF
ncbi:hypothetical protein MBOT_00910 [Mycobacterium botniense]|uniref:Uncharacterized protein n=1 Tax=Mycobacterium botniense TaxID=84962 RepID=A0A7I9XTQ1_9MYCO|nr:hypothetical protein MBOT_00910 [Mycobacterium botniense]